MFEDRADAGRRLAGRLRHYAGTDALILAVPRGGVPVAASAARTMGLEWNVIVTRKLPVPWSPEAGFGAVADDGSVVVNDGMVEELQLTPAEVQKAVDAVQAEVLRRSEAYSRLRPASAISDRTAILMDDGLASGYTMLAAIKSVRSRGPRRVVVASPVASRHAALMIEPAADECVFQVVSPALPFAVADFYLAWHDLTDEDIAPLLRGS